MKVQSDQAIKERQCIETLNAAKIGLSWWKTRLPIQWAGRIHFSVLLMARVSSADYVISLHWSAFQPQVFVYNSGKCWVWAAGRIRMVMAHLSQPPPLSWWWKYSTLHLCKRFGNCRTAINLNWGISIRIWMLVSSDWLSMIPRTFSLA